MEDGGRRQGGTKGGDGRRGRVSVEHGLSCAHVKVLRRTESRAFGPKEVQWRGATEQASDLRPKGQVGCPRPGEWPAECAVLVSPVQPEEDQCVSDEAGTLLDSPPAFCSPPPRPPDVLRAVRALPGPPHQKQHP